MFNDVFKNEKVIKFFKDISKNEVYQNKNIPVSIGNELIDSSYYAALIGIDAIFKYVIIIKDLTWFDEYLTEVQLLLRKVSNHNDIKIGINKLIINYTKLKLKIKEIKTCEDKKNIIETIYNNYIVDGYYFHSFPSIFIDDVKTNGLRSSNYNYELESLKEIELVFEKYKTSNVFSKELENMNRLVLTDSIFMGAFYAYNSPNFLKELALGLVDKKDKCVLNSFFMKNYKLSRKNLVHYIRKVDMFNSDSYKVISIFDKEWDLFDINNSYPVVALIKRNVFRSNYLDDINKIIDDDINDDLVSAVTKILSMGDNQRFVDKDIASSDIEIIYLPSLDELEYKIDSDDKKKSQDQKVTEFANNYGSSSIMALIGLMLVEIGLLVYFIMLG